MRKKTDFYDLIVLGGGSAGLVAAKFGIGIGKKTLLIEKRKLGGDCTWFGCVPSKALIKSAYVAKTINNMESYGLKPLDGKLNYTSDGALNYVRNLVNEVYQTETPEIFEKEGIKVEIGNPVFLNESCLKVNDKIFEFGKCIIATGSSPLIPDISGLSEIDFLTNETIFDLKKIPESLIVLGGGPIGVEFSQAFSRLGSDVCLIHKYDNILNRDDVELTLKMQKLLEYEGVKILTGAKDIEIVKTTSGAEVLLKGKGEKIFAEKLVVATGRKPNVKGLDLSSAGVEFSSDGITTNDFLQTTSSRIYAAGDVVGPYRFTHVAEYMAVTACRNAFFPGGRKIDYSNVGWTTFTEPEFARTGLTEAEAVSKFPGKIKVFSWDYEHLDRAKTDSERQGFAKFILNSDGLLLGAHILGSRAGELIHEAMVLKQFKIPFHKATEIIHIYPTFADIIKQPAKKALIDRLVNNPFMKVIKKLKGS